MRVQNIRRRRLLCITTTTLSIVFIWCFYEADLKIPSVKIAARTEDTNITARTTSSRIPFIIHQTWKDTDVPLVYKPWIKSCIDKNPEFEFWFWTDRDIWRYMSHKHRAYVELFEDYPNNINRVDAFRYFILYEYGGIYIDLDMECLKPLHPLLSSQHSCILSTEAPAHSHFLTPVRGPLVSNALMACAPHHPLMDHLINSLGHYMHWIPTDDVMHTTGPNFITSAYNSYVKQHKNPDEMSKVYLAPFNFFHPTLDESRIEKIKDRCKHREFGPFADASFVDLQKALCRDILTGKYQNMPVSVSYTNHHWTHSWAGPNNDPYRLLKSELFYDYKRFTRKKKTTL